MFSRCLLYTAFSQWCKCKLCCLPFLPQYFQKKSTWQWLDLLVYVLVYDILCVYVSVWINQHNTKWFTIPSNSTCCSQHRPEKPRAARLCSDRFFSCFSLQKCNKWFAICMQARFVHSEPGGISLHGMGLVLYHVDLSRKIRCRKIFSF